MWRASTKPEAAPQEPGNVPTGCGEAEALFQLGLKFANEGGSESEAQALEQYLKAAAQNHVRAQANLAMMYANGRGVRRDQAQCMMWLSKAANLGDAEAQYHLGMRQNRISMDQEAQAREELRIEAYKWLRLAAAQAYPEALTGCDFISMGMTHESVLEGNRRAAAFAAVSEGNSHLRG